MNNGSFNPFQMAQNQFDAVADKLKLDQSLKDFLRFPMRELHFIIPVKMDNGDTKIFQGFRIQHSLVRGPAKGGIRFHPDETIDTVRALSMWMTWKTSVVDIPLGGGKGGVICNPRELSQHELEHLCRGYARAIAYFSGPVTDVPAPDVMTNPQMMCWMMDEFNVIHNGEYPGFITGKPLGAGGSQGRTEATGFGTIYMVREALKLMGRDIKGATCSIQGFGNVSQYAAKLFIEMGGKVLCVSCWDPVEKKPFVLVNKKGVDINFLMANVDTYGTIDRSKLNKDYELSWDADLWLEQDVDVLIPAAAENMIREDNVKRIKLDKVKIVAEGANGPTTPGADKVLKQHKIFMIPDFLCNSGGVTCSYFEQVQNNMNYYWTKEEVLKNLDQKLTAAFHSVHEMAKSRNEYTRDAAYMIAIERVAKTARLRGMV